MLQQEKETCLLLFFMPNKNNRKSTRPVSLTLGDCHILAGGTAGEDAKDQCTPQSSALQVGRVTQMHGFVMCGSIFKSNRTVSVIIILRTSECI